MISIRDVTFKIKNKPIIDDVSVEIPKGSLTALIGPNGAGKSTLLKLIARLEKLRYGQICVDQLDIATTPTGELALKMAVMSQQVHIASRLRLAELVSFGRWPRHHGRPSAEDKAAVERALHMFDLNLLADRFIDEVSGGQAQRAFLAMTFAQETEWLLLDEPLNNLDMAHARELMRKLVDLVRCQDKSVLLVVHDINYAAAWADNIVAMKDGRVHAAGHPNDVLTSDCLSMLYDTRIAVSSGKRPFVLHYD